MYCKNCGRELKDGTRFCDRCGQSVRQSNKSERAARREEIEALKEERLNRKKKMADLEAEKAAKKAKKKQIKKSRKRNTKLIYIIAVILIVLVSAIVSYIVTTSGSKNAAWKTQDESIELNSTAVPTIQPTQGSSAATPAPSALPTVASEPENTDAVNADGYRVFQISDNMSFPYPSSFTKKSVSGDIKLSIMDTVGGATVTLTQSKSSVSAKELMKEYAQTTGGTISYSLAGNDWYGITITKNNIIYHRKCLLKDNTLIYYDFQYDENSVSASEYETYINYMDEAFSF